MIFQFTPLREGRRKIAFWINPYCNFNSRPSARGDAHCMDTMFSISHFNSRPSARGDDDLRYKYLLEHIFQFTPLREGRRGTRRTSPGTADISIHAPPRGATFTVTTIYKPRRFQFTPLREGRPDILLRPLYTDFISIHAPPRGATAQVVDLLMR